MLTLVAASHADKNRQEQSSRAGLLMTCCVQALITGVFSIVHQLLALNCIPRVKVSSYNPPDNVQHMSLV